MTRKAPFTTSKYWMPRKKASPSMYKRDVYLEGRQFAYHIPSTSSNVCCNMKGMKRQEQKQRSYKGSLPIISVRHRSYDPDGKTTVEILNKNSETLMIDSYSQVGFRLNNGIYVFGPMAVFPRTVLSWNINNAEEINEDSLSLFCLLEPKIDILVLGVGDDTNSSKLNRSMLSFMANYRINIEVLTTDQACATFNFLTSENRYIAGALIPPVTLRPTEDDVILSKMRYKRLYGNSDEDY